jgi:hypothetical protein
MRVAIVKGFGCKLAVSLPFPRFPTVLRVPREVFQSEGRASAVTLQRPGRQAVNLQATAARQRGKRLWRDLK